MEGVASKMTQTGPRDRPRQASTHRKCPIGMEIHGLALCLAQKTFHKQMRRFIKIGTIILRS